MLGEYWYEEANPSIFKQKKVVRQAVRLLAQLHTTSTMGPIDAKSLARVAKHAHMFVAWKRNGNTRQPRGVLVGVVTLNMVYETDGIAGTINEVVVTNHHRGKGIARTLMHRAITYARINGLAELELTSNPTRKEAHKLYKSLGFAIRKTKVFNLKLT